MCGIAGWINLKQDIQKYTGVLDEMSRTLAARGPDSHGTWSSANALIAHRRLAVVDPKGGAQPMERQIGERKYIITYNGELYNTAEIRTKLEGLGYKFYTNSDTEVLLVSYIEWGEGCTEYLNGIFAFGIWSEAEKSLFLARDRFGVKPLFYAQRGESFIFASELKALLAHPLIEAQIDAEGLSEVFSLGPAKTPGHGIYKNVYEVKPAHSIFIDNNGIRVRRYWSLVSEPHEDSFEDTVEKVKSLVYDSIERQFVADVPVCTFLSGGLDSSAISAIAARYFKKRGQVLHTYSIDYKDNDIYFKPSAFQPNQDAPWVKRMNEHIGSIHHNITIDTPMLVEALRGAVLARDLPGMTDVDSSLWLFCREIKKDATVALSGECADEIFGGYPWFHREDLMNANTFPWSRFLDERTGVLLPELIYLIKPSRYVERRYQETLDEVPRLPGESQLEARRREIFYLNITWFMQTLLDRKDRMSMSTGLEVRVPYCDHRLAQYVWNVPWEIKALEGREKGLLRKAFEGLLPDDVLYRKKSPYPKTHNPAYERAVKKWLSEIIEERTSPLLGLINIKAVKDLLASENTDYGRPWFGQLMALPQLFAYLIQVNIWLSEYKVSIV